MKTIEIKRRELNFSDYVKRTALESDYSNLVKEDCLIVEDGVNKILYKKLEINTDAVRQATKSIKYEKNTRTSGLKTVSRIFGFNPRNAIRKDYCSATSLSYENPKQNKIICDFGNELSKLYANFFPQVYRAHEEVVSKKIKQDWRIGDTPFTSGIINKNNPLKYHFDAGNIKNVLSNMVVFKKDVEGGYLSCPEFDLAFEVADNTVILFDGQNILHGVTPIKRLNKYSYRYSIVYYTLEQMWNCLILDEEIVRARKKHLERERKRAYGLVSAKGLQFSKVRAGIRNHPGEKL